MRRARRLLYVTVVVLVSLAAWKLRGARVAERPHAHRPSARRRSKLSREQPRHESPETLTPAALKTKYTGYKSATKSLLSIAPSLIKPDLQKVFTSTTRSSRRCRKRAGASRRSRCDPEELGGQRPRTQAVERQGDLVLRQTCGLKYPNAAVSPTSTERCEPESPIELREVLLEERVPLRGRPGCVFGGGSP